MKLYENGADAELISSLSEVSNFTNLLNEIEELSKLDPLDFSEQTFSLIHRLIEYASLSGPRPSFPLNDLLQLTLLAVMTTALPNYTGEVVRYKTVAQNLKRAILQYAVASDKDRELVMWAAFVGRVSILDDDQDAWITSMVSKTSHEAQIHTWPQVRRILSGYCWIHSLHDAIAMRTWEKVLKQRALVRNSGHGSNLTSEVIE